MQRLACRVCTAALLVVASACDPQIPDKALVVDSAGVRIVEYRAVDVPAPIVRVAEEPSRRFGGFNAVTGTEIGEVMGRAALVGRHVIVADAMSHNVRRFSVDDGSGEIIGRNGEGPGEFVLPTVVGVLPGDSVVVYDAQLRRVSILESDGKYARSFNVPPEVRVAFGGAGVLEGGRIAFTGALGLRLEGRQRVVQDTVPVVVLGPTGEYESEFGAFPNQGYFEGPPNQRPRALELPYTPGALIAAGPSGVFVGATDGFEIRRFESSGSLLGVIRLPLLRVPVTAADLDSVLTKEMQAASNGLEASVRTLFGLMPTPEFKPPFRQLFVDPLGRLWAQPVSIDPTLKAWLVFDSNGDLVGSAELPDGQLLCLDGGHAVMLTHDQYDAQVISVFEVEATRGLD